LTIPLFAVEMLKRGNAQSQSIFVSWRLLAGTGKSAIKRKSTTIPTLFDATGGGVNICLLLNGLNAMV
jgi:hypothetical protein